MEEYYIYIYSEKKTSKVKQAWKNTEVEKTHAMPSTDALKGFFEEKMEEEIEACDGEDTVRGDERWVRI